MSYGVGHIRRYRTRDGRERFNVRVPDGKGGHISLGSYDSEAEAIRIRAAGLIELKNSPRVRMTFAAFGEIWLGRLADQRSIKESRSRWAQHVAQTELGQMPVEDILAPNVRDFARALPRRISIKTGKAISPQTAIHVFGLVRRCLAEAVTDGLLADDPSAGVRLPIGKRHRDWTYLTVDEIDAVLAVADLTDEQRAVFQVAVYQGLRLGEIAALTWDCIDFDSDAPQMRVERSWDRPATKNGAHRTIPVLPPAVAVLRRWREVSGRRTGLVFPAPSGGLYAKGHDWRWGERRLGYRDVATRAGITRRVRFHDLRHTCGSGLVNGFWGEPWTLEAVRDFLGHSSVAQTERYAHLDRAVLSAAAAATTGKPTQLAARAGQQSAGDMEPNMEALAEQVAAKVLQAIGTAAENDNTAAQRRFGISSQ